MTAFKSPSGNIPQGPGNLPQSNPTSTPGVVTGPYSPPDLSDLGARQPTSDADIQVLSKGGAPPPLSERK